MLRPETSLAPVAGTAPVEPYRTRWFNQAWGDFMAKLKQEATPSGIAGIISLLIAIGLFLSKGGWASLLPVAIFTLVLLVYFIVFFFRAPAKLDTDRQSEIDGLNTKARELNTNVKEKGREIERLTERVTELDTKVIPGLKSDILTWEFRYGFLENNVSALTSERDSLKSELEERDRHKLTCEVDTNHQSQVFLIHYPEDTPETDAPLNRST